MPFGKIKNIQLSNVSKFVFAYLLFCGCVTTGSCQSKEVKVASALQRCQQILDKDDIDGAVRCYLEAGLANPEADDLIIKTSEDAVFKKCVDYTNKEDFKNALICFEGAVGLMPEKANVRFFLADAYFQYDKAKGYSSRGDFELLNRAEKEMKEGLTIDPKDAFAHSVYGNILDSKGERKKAMDEYKQALKLAPNDAFYWVRLAMMQEKLGENETAVSSFQQALKINPNNTVALFFLEELYAKMGQVDDAIETIERRLKLEPASEETLQKLKELKEKRAIVKPTKSKAKAMGN